MVTHRLERLSEEIRHCVSELLLTEIRDPGINNPGIRAVTITRVTLTKDLGFARIYYGVSKVDSRQDIQRSLTRAAGFIRKKVVERLALRIAPQIEFFYDETKEEIDRVEGLFSRL